MNARSLLSAIAVAAAAFSGAASADTYFGAHMPVEFKGTLTRAEVQAEAVRYAAAHSLEPAGSRVTPLVQSSTERTQVRAEAVEALRLGKIPHGEFSF